MSGLITRLKAALPTPDSIAANRWMKPVAHHFLRPDLWHLNRRSVPRAVAVGLLVAAIIPVAHTLVAAMAAVPTRANLVIAAAITWLINPFTIAPFYYAAYLVGTALLHLGAISPVPHITHPAAGQAASWAAWLVETSGPLVLGILVMAVIIASTGYLVASFGWRWNIGRKWRARAAKRARFH